MLNETLKIDMNTKVKKIPGVNSICDYFIEKGINSKRPISNKKLQKLLYYAQAWSLVLRNKRLFDDSFEAWVHGPAIRSVYKKYKKFGYNPITEVDENESFKISNDTKKILDEVWRVYGSKDANYLELLTHAEKPWIDARDGLSVHQSSDNVITRKKMKKYYSSLLPEPK